MIEQQTVVRVFLSSCDPFEQFSTIPNAAVTHIPWHEADCLRHKPIILGRDGMQSLANAKSARSECYGYSSYGKSLFSCQWFR